MMARLNVEDEFWVDPRFRALVRLLKDEDKAAGMCIRAWRIAQKYWGNGAFIPAKIWELESLEALIEVDLAEVRPDGVYCKGAEHHFEWYAQKVEAGRHGGQQSAEARRLKYGTSDPHALRSKREAPLHRTRSTASQSAEAAQKRAEASKNPPAPALTHTSYKEVIDAPSSPPARKGRKPPSDGAQLWAPYCEAFKARYDHEPVRNAMVNAKLGQLASRVGLETAIRLLKFYFAANDDWLVKRAHPLGLLVKEAESWVTKMQTPARVKDPFGGRDLAQEFAERGHD